MYLLTYLVLNFPVFSWWPPPPSPGGSSSSSWVVGCAPNWYFILYSICSGLLEKLESVVMKSRLYNRGSVPIRFPWRWQVLYYGNLNITIYDLKTNSGFRIPNNTSVVWFRNYYYLNSEEVKFTVRLYKEEAVWRLLAIITLFWNLHLESFSKITLIFFPRKVQMFGSSNLIL